MGYEGTYEAEGRECLSIINIASYERSTLDADGRERGALGKYDIISHERSTKGYKRRKRGKRNPYSKRKARRKKLVAADSTLDVDSILIRLTALDNGERSTARYINS